MVLRGRHMAGALCFGVSDVNQSEVGLEPIRENPIAPWELRVGDLRVFYDASPDEPNVVEIVVVGIKKGNRLLVAGKEMKL